MFVELIPSVKNSLLLIGSFLNYKSEEKNGRVFWKCRQSPECKARAISKVPWSSGGYQCKQCFKIYRHKQSLHTHVKFECGKDPTFDCPVEDCAYRAKRKGHLKMHMNKIHCLELQAKRRP
ncbi:hypothetical protein ILUMI_02650 [Ignelater luminosus]|uniref:C2H2-type domain-containing protein n=1 Tax=Ignelater luminosus TaxID=2038154 RepID=A0A8K0GKN3_IGNLU|nr:hypothetical protein ILUMI_02650 [Ignelater luminosus]